MKCKTPARSLKGSLDNLSKLGLPNRT